MEWVQASGKSGGRCKAYYQTEARVAFVALFTFHDFFGAGGFWFLQLANFFLFFMASRLLCFFFESCLMAAHSAHSSAALSFFFVQARQWHIVLLLLLL